jgi:sugar-specific transcriptional regulator TrmB
MMDEYKLRQQSEAAGRLMDELMGEIADDPSIAIDAIESETDLLETIEKAIDEIDAVEVLIKGLAEKIKEFGERKTILVNRVNRVRALVEQAMVICDQYKITLPTATLSLRKNPPGLVILDEAVIPAKYFAKQPRPAPKLDKAALKAALTSDDVSEAETIIGAEMDNGSVSLTIRRK